mmetsp:Transcript_91765/g.262374  ORF Transcript_91765/g.262374 Transcript_91765/m.262374 type:complete len:243 (-) Transcript_91765:390-1118(-)
MAPATPRRLESPGSTSNEMAPLIENQPATGIFTLSPGTISTPCVDVSNTARQFRPAGPVLYIASASESFARGNCRPSCVDERPGPPPLRVPARTIVKSAPMAFALSMTFFSSAVYADTYSPLEVSMAVGCWRRSWRRSTQAGVVGVVVVCSCCGWCCSWCRHWWCACYVPCPNVRVGEVLRSFDEETQPLAATFASRGAVAAHEYDLFHLALLVGPLRHDRVEHPRLHRHVAVGGDEHRVEV